MLRSWTRTPWPTLASGTVLIALGLAVHLSHPLTKLSDPEEAFVTTNLLAGFLLVSVSLALVDARDGRDALRRWKSGLRSVIAFVLLLYGVGFLNDRLYALLNPSLGPPGSPSRLAFVAVTALLYLLALGKGISPLAEALRRAAAWLGESERPRS